jgi:hypothetical protein
MATENPTTLDKLAAIAGQAAIYIPVGGQLLQIASVSLHALSALLDSPDADKSKLDALHLEYLRRIALAKDPNS